MIDPGNAEFVRCFFNFARLEGGAPDTEGIASTNVGLKPILVSDDSDPFSFQYDTGDPGILCLAGAAISLTIFTDITFPGGLLVLPLTAIMHL